jgi:hypothetical protein
MKCMRLSAVAPRSRRRASVAKLSTEVPPLLRRAHASGRAGCQPGPVRHRFAGTEELARYQQHPVHKAFHSWIMERRCTPLAFDYFLDGIPSS